MFFRILKSDLRHKKIMNIILFLFLTITSILLASGVNLYFTVSGMVENFMDKANVPDQLIAAANKQESDEAVEQWLEKCTLLEEHSKETAIMLNADNFIIPEQFGKTKIRNMLLAVKQPRTHGRIFNEKDEILKLDPGQMAIPNNFLEDTELQEGDKVSLVFGNISKEFTIVGHIKDAGYGTGLMGMERVLISDLDYDELFSVIGEESQTLFWLLDNKEGFTEKDLMQDFNNQNFTFQIIFNIGSDAVATTYVMDLLMAYILLLIAILLMLVALLVLRFTILFTLQDEYREIGIMRAIGLKAGAVQRLYLVKYMALAVLGGIAGYLCSIGFTDIMTAGIRGSMILEKSIIAELIAAAAAGVMVLLTLFFCWSCTRRVNKVSAVSAIRGGKTGENFSGRKKIRVSGCLRVRVPFLLAVSDLYSSFRRFFMLMLIFIMGTILILVPVNTINTLQSDRIMSTFGIGPIDLVVDRSDDWSGYWTGKEMEDLQRELAAIETSCGELGIEVSLRPEISYMLTFYADNPQDNRTTFTSVSIGYDIENYPILRGNAPKEKDELAVTSIIAEYFGVGIGDFIHCVIDGEQRDFMITALYQSMSNLGYGIRLSEKAEIALEGSTGITVAGTLGEGQNKEESIALIKKELEGYEVRSAKEFMNSMVGGILDQLGFMRNIGLTVILGMNALITALMVRMMVSKEVPEIAVLKSLGFRSRALKTWQLLRILIIAVISVMISALMSAPVSKVLTSFAFRIAGATEIEMCIIPTQVYLFYPLMVLFTVLAVTALSLGEIKRVKIWEINNQE